MPPVQENFADHASAVLARCCIDALGFTRLCANRQCRRHLRCRDTADRTPCCAASLEAGDFDELARLHQLVVDILENRHPPKPSTDPATRDREKAAIVVMYNCLAALPCYRERLIAWYRRYAAPPPPVAPPAPPIDTAAVLAEMKAELERYRMIDETREETEALRQRLAGYRVDQR